MLAAVSGLPVREWQLIGSGDGAAALLIPTAGGQEWLEQLRLELFFSEGVVYGELEVETPPRSLGGAVRGLVGVGRHRHPVRFKIDDLDAMRGWFRETLRRDRQLA